MNGLWNVFVGFVDAANSRKSSNWGSCLYSSWWPIANNLPQCAVGANGANASSIGASNAATSAGHLRTHIKSVGA